MTTVIGFKTNINEEAIIMCSDTQLSYLDDQDNPISKRKLLKIVYGEFWAISSIGVDTQELRSFYNKLRNPEDKRYKDFNKEKLVSMINRAIEKQRFIEILFMNADYVRESRSTEQTNEFLFAINKPSIELYHIDSYGNLLLCDKNINYMVIGSGSEDAQSYINEQLEGETYDSSNIDIKIAIKLGRDALRKAKKDIKTGLPMDLVILKKDSIKVYGKRISDAIEKAEEKELESIIEEELKGVNMS